MADFGLGTFKEMGGDLASNLISGAIMVFLVLICGAVIVSVLMYVRYLRQFNVRVEIKSLRGSGTQGEPIYKIVSDKGGMILNKKDKRHYFRLLKERIELPPPPLDCMELQANGTNQIKILQKSQDEYYYLLPEKIELKKIVKGGKLVLLAEAHLNVVEGDISYWNVLRKRDNRKLFDTENLLLKILPYVGIFLMFITVIFLTYMITDHWGTFSDAAASLAEAAKALERASTATVITSSGVG